MAMNLPANPENAHVLVNDADNGKLIKDVVADATLSDTEARNLIHEYTGTLVADLEVIVPSEQRKYMVYNNSSGAFTLTVKAVTGTGIVIAQGARAIIEWDGANMVRWTADL